MGGGVGMRAAAKVVGFTAAAGGLRGVTAENYPATFAVRKVAPSFPVSAVASSSEDVKLVVSQSQSPGDVHRPSWEIDDWEFAGGEEDLMITGGGPMPRVVFGGAPTLQEAADATSELTVAVNKAYLSATDSSSSNSKVLDTRNIMNEKTIAPAVPTHAIQAFKLLNESSAAQNVVASISCDPNVWNAVLQNSELQSFLQSQKTCLASPDMNSNTNESVADTNLLDQPSRESFDISSDSSKSETGNVFSDAVQKIKLDVVDMMSTLSDYFQNFFRSQSANKIFANADGTARLNTVETVLEASFMGLAVMAIMVILLKRG